MSHFLTFVNHGCNGTHNLGHTDLGYTDFTIDLDQGLPENLGFRVPVPYNPPYDRDPERQMAAIVTAKDIAADDELLDSYLDFEGSDGFVEMVKYMQNMCSGGLGLVEEYQNSHHQRSFKSVIDKVNNKEEGGSLGSTSTDEL